jgi:hypothetical protein
LTDVLAEYDISHVVTDMMRSSDGWVFWGCIGIYRYNEIEVNVS